MDEDFRRAALDYHRLPRPGKLSVEPTKRMATQRDLGLAYSPGVAAACEEIARDPERAMIVIDPRRTETAQLADFHLQVRPGRDAWLVAALAAVIVQERLVDQAFLDEHTVGAAEIADVLGAGTRTKDIAAPGANAVSTTEMGEAIIKALEARG